MKALIIIAAVIVLAFILRIADVLASRKVINSAGAKANLQSKNMVKLDINNEEDLKTALEYYKGLED